MPEKPTYEELEQRVKRLEEEASKRKQTKQALQESEELFRLAFDTSPDSMVISRLSDGYIFNVNKGFTDKSGYTKGEVIGKTTDKIKIWADPKDREEFVAALQRDGSITDFKAKYSRKDGSIITSLLSANVFKLKNEEYILTATRDISELIKAEEALHTFQRAVECSSDAIGISTPDGKHYYHNEAFKKLFGYKTAKELAAAGGGPSVYKDEDIASKVFEAIEGGRTWQGEVVMYNKRRNEIPILLRADSIKDAKGNLIAIMGSHTDITERKKAEEALRKSEERYKGVFDNTSTCFAVYQPVNNGEDFTFKDFNRAAEGSEKIAKEALIGQSLLRMFPAVKEFYSEKHEMSFFEALQHVYKTREPLHFPIGFYEDKRIAGWRDNYLFKSGDLVVAAYTDETERMQTLEELRESKERLASIIRFTPDIIYRLDHEGKITFVSDAVSKYGYAPEDLIGRNLLEFVHPDDLEKAEYRLNERRGGDRSTKSLELRLFAKDRTIVPFESVAQGIEESMGNEKVFLIQAEGIYEYAEKQQKGSFLGTQGVARDITERKRTEQEKSKLEAQLQQAQKMESIGTLTGGIAHDLNNILSAIVTYQELTLCELDDMDPAKRRVKAAIASTDKAVEFVRAMLEFGRPEEYKFELTDLYMSTEFAKKQLDKINMAKKKNVSFELIGEGNFTSMADSSKIIRVLMNLGKNALDAIPEDKEGKVVYEFKKVVLDDEYCKSKIGIKPGEYIEIRVTDNGVGIPEEVKGNIFEPMFSTKQIGEGTGLGLAIVYTTIKKHDGFIDLESKVGEGTIFKAYFPYHEGEVIKKEGYKPKIYHGKGEKILIVEDTDVNRQLLTELLEQTGYVVETAANAEEGIKKYHQTNPAVVIMDEEMPGMYGTEAAQQILSKDPSAKIIFSSGTGKTEEEYKEIGGVGSVSKPFKMEKLTGKIHEVLSKR